MALVVFLRGVNVGGHRTFRPSILAKELAELGVVNVGAAGTFIINKAVSQSKLREALIRKLPFETEIIICESRDLIAATSRDPFGNAPSSPEYVRFVSVLSRHARKVPMLPVHYPPEGDWFVKVISIKGRFLFGIYRRHMKAVRYISQLDKLCGVPLTTRNWNTINSIVKLLA